MDFIAPDISQIDLIPFMQAALMEADLAGQAGELPIGAVVVIDGEIIARGRASHKTLRNQIRHAEINALLDGGGAVVDGLPARYLIYQRRALPDVPRRGGHG